LNNKDLEAFFISGR